MRGERLVLIVGRQMNTSFEVMIEFIGDVTQFNKIHALALVVSAHRGLVLNTTSPSKRQGILRDRRQLRCDIHGHIGSVSMIVESMSVSAVPFMVVPIFTWS